MDVTAATLARPTLDRPTPELPAFLVFGPLVVSAALVALGILAAL